MPNLTTLTAVIAVFGAFFWAQADDAKSSESEPTELQQAQHSRDFAARKVCQGKAFEWQGDVLVCFKEQP